jgi:hypothetical protein
MARDIDLMEQELSNGYHDYYGYSESTKVYGPQLNLDVAYDPNASVATVSFTDGLVSVQVTGASKRNIGEPKDEARGKHLAEARALRNLALYLESLHPDTL